MSQRSGFIIIDKPTGATSFSMVGLVRRLIGVRRVGHAGTLDPLASGVLPVAIGPATRLIEYMEDAPKVYLASVRFGTTTDTYDAEGQINSTHDASGLTHDRVSAALREFIGEVDQVPPLYSAIKVAGKPLYRYARAGVEVARRSRRVRIDGIELRSFGDGIAEIEVTCGKGTYIRSLAHDLGERLGCGAHLVALRRASSGGFGLEEAHTPAAVAQHAADGTLEDLLLAPDRAVERRPAAILGAALAGDIAAGRNVRLEGVAEAEISRVYTLEGEFLGMLRHVGSCIWHPSKVTSRA